MEAKDNQRVSKYDADLDANRIDRAAKRFVTSNEFKNFTFGWGLYDHTFHNPAEYRSYVRQFVGPDSKATTDEGLAEEFYKEYRKQTSLIGMMLHTEFKNASHQHFGAKCEFCGTGVFDENMETPASKMGALSKVSNDPQPDLVFDNEFVLSCNSCGGPTDIINLAPITGRFSINLVEERQYAWGFQKANQIIGADIKMTEFINGAVLRPYQEGKEIFVNRMVQKLKGEEE